MPCFSPSFSPEEKPLHVRLHWRIGCPTKTKGRRYPEMPWTGHRGRWKRVVESNGKAQGINQFKNRKKKSPQSLPLTAPEASFGAQGTASKQPSSKWLPPQQMLTGLTLLSSGSHDQQAVTLILPIEGRGIWFNHGALAVSFCPAHAPCPRGMAPSAGCRRVSPGAALTGTFIGPQWFTCFDGKRKGTAYRGGIYKARVLWVLPVGQV